MSRVDFKNRVMFDVKNPSSVGVFTLVQNDFETSRTIDLKGNSSDNQSVSDVPVIDSPEKKVRKSKKDPRLNDKKLSHFDKIINSHIGDPRDELIRLASAKIVKPKKRPARYIKQAKTIKNPPVSFVTVKEPSYDETNYNDVLLNIQEQTEDPSVKVKFPETKPVDKPENKIDIKIQDESEPKADVTIVNYGSFDTLLADLELNPDPVVADYSLAGEETYGLGLDIQQSVTKDLVSEIPLFHISNDEPVKKNKKHRLALWLVGGVIVAGILVYYFLGFGLDLKKEIMDKGNDAVSSLMNAEEDLKNFDFESATVNFMKANESFSATGEKLNFMGANLSSIFSALPGGEKIKSANNLIEAGKYIAQSGQALSEAVDAISKTSSVLDPGVNPVTIQGIVKSISEALFVSQKNIARAQILMNDVDEEIIPEEKKEDFLDFKSQMPELKKSIDEAIEYSSSLESFIGLYGEKKYLLMFQNNSELRPTGGFPGTYGIITLKDGKLSDFFVDDIYNFDGQLKENIVPPKQLQHITPNWGMRDANWFADFPTSARKIQYFYEKISGKKVDGVIALGPDLISSILNIIGPIEMPEYELTLSGDNFLSSVQAEVEYGENRVQPKKIVVDLAPKFLAKINSVSTDQWLAIFNILTEKLTSKDVLMYFNDLDLRNFAIKEGLDGSLKKTEGDYLMMNIANIKGSKTDKFINSEAEVNISVKGDKLVHEVKLTRRHNGGQTNYGFYNRQNPAYVRFLVPLKAELISVSGNDKPDFRSLIGHSDYNFSVDPDLNQFEAGFIKDQTNNVDIFEESGLRAFGLWLITDPGSSKTVTVKYELPFNENAGEYSMYVQKQPGIVIKDVDITFNLTGLEVNYYSPDLNRIGSVFNSTRPLDSDVQLGFIFD